MQAPSQKKYEFPPFYLDPDRQVLLRNGDRVRLTQKAFATLVALIGHHGHTVDKTQLINLVWDKAVVEENNLTQCISSIRKVLGESPDEPRFILTVPGQGYRFIAEVREVVREGSLEPRANPETLESAPAGRTVAVQHRSPESPKRVTLWRGIAAVLAAIFFVSGIVGISRISQSARSRHNSGLVPASVAVLPFLNLSGNVQNDYFSDGFTEELTTALAEIRGLRVVARTSAFQFRGKSEDVRSVGEQLNVGAIIEGSVTRSEDQLHVTAQLVSTRDGYHLWSHTYDAPRREIYGIQQEIVLETMRALGLPARSMVRHDYPASVEAHDLYLEGRYFWNKRDLPDMERSIRLFEAAIQKDPQFARAYAGLADAYVVMGGNGQKPLSEVVPRAQAALDRALKLDPELAELHATRALLNSELSGERRELEPELRRAVELSPGYASAHHWLGLILTTNGRFEEADAELRKAQLLDPLSPMITEGVAENFYYWRRYDDAIAEVQRIRKMGSDLGDSVLGRAYIEKSQYQDAIAVFSTLEERRGTPLPLIQLAITYAASGDQKRARTLLRQALSARDGYVAPYWVAIAHIYLGEEDAAFDWLERAHRQNDPLLGCTKVDPMLDMIRSDERYRELLRKADLSD